MRARITMVVILVLPLLFFGAALGGEGVDAVAGKADSVKVHADSSCGA